MKTRNYDFGLPACCAAGRMTAQQQTAPEQKLQYRHKAIPSSSGKEKETCASRCTKSSWKTAKKRSANL